MPTVARLVRTPFGAETFLLGVGEYKVGRSAECDVYLDDPTVSRVHATLVVGEKQATVRDHGSLNGTFVGGEAVGQHPLDHGAELAFGSVHCVYERVDRRGGDESTTSGGLPLHTISPAERLVFDLLLLGRSEKEIAKELTLSRHTVHNHVKRIYRAFGVHTRSELLSAVLNARHPRGTEAPQPK